MPDGNGWRPRHSPWTVAMTVTLATFMEILDGTVANVALPHIAGNLSVGEDEATWVLTSYLIANAIVLPMSGWLAGLVGRKRFYMTCVATFTAASLACGLAPDLTTLIVMRVIQGAGGGGLQPSEQAILADTFEPRKRGMAFAVYGMAVVLAPAIGPTLGGFITDNASWRWIFFINVPVGIVSLVLSSRVVEDPPWARARPARARELDWVGVALIVVGLGCLQYVLDKGQREDWFSSGLITACAVTSVLCVVGAALWEWFHPRPVVDVRLFRTGNFAVASLMMLMLGAALFGTTVLLPLFLQDMLGWTAQQAGEALSAGALLVIVTLPLVGRLTQHIDGRWLIAFGFAVTAASLFHMAHITLDVDFRTATMYRVYQAAGMAFLFIPITTGAYVGIPVEKNNQVSAVINLMRNVGASIGISVATTLIARRAQMHQERLASYVTPTDAGVRAAVHGLTARFLRDGAGMAEATKRAYATVYGAVVRQATTMAYEDTIWVLAVACALLVPLALVMRRSKPGASPVGAH